MPVVDLVCHDLTVNQYGNVILTGHQFLPAQAVECNPIPSLIMTYYGFLKEKEDISEMMRQVKSTHNSAGLLQVYGRVCLVL